MDLKTQMKLTNQERKNENFELKNQIHSMITLVKKEQKDELSYLKSQINSINFSIEEWKKEQKDNNNSLYTVISDLKNQMQLLNSWNQDIKKELILELINSLLPSYPFVGIQNNIPVSSLTNGFPSTVLCLW